MAAMVKKSFSRVDFAECLDSPFGTFRDPWIDLGHGGGIM